MFSVIVPVYNKLPHLKRCLASIHNQTYKNYEIIIVCDPSTDGSTEEIEALKELYPEMIVLSRRTPGPGGYRARNLGIEKAKFEWLAFLDADDRWLDDHLEKLQHAIVSKPAIKLFAASYQKSTQVDDYTQEYEIAPFHYTVRDLKDFCRKPNLQTSGICVHSSVVEKFGGFPEYGITKGGDVDTFFKWIYSLKYYVQLENITTIYYTDAVGMVTKSSEFKFTDYANTFLSNCDAPLTNLPLTFYIRRRRNTVIFHMIKKNHQFGAQVDWRFILNITFLANPVKFTYFVVGLLINRLVPKCQEKK